MCPERTARFWSEREDLTLRPLVSQTFRIGIPRLFRLVHKQHCNSNSFLPMFSRTCRWFHHSMMKRARPQRYPIGDCEAAASPLNHRAILLRYLFALFVAAVVTSALRHFL